MKPATGSSAIEMVAREWVRRGGADIATSAGVRRRHRLPPTAAWFVIRRFGETFVGTLATFIVLDLLASFIDKFDALVNYGILRPAGIEYLLMKLPLMTAQLMPVACLAGVLFGLGMLNRNGELMALQSLGISRAAIALPLLLLSALLSVVAFGLNETIAPAATRRAKYLLNGEIRKDPIYGFSALHWLRTRYSFVGVTVYDELHKRLLGVRIFEIGPAYTLRAIYSAQSADWSGKDWIFSGLSGLTIHGHHEVRPGAPADFHLDATPEDFSFVLLNPEEFSLSELDRYIEKLRRNGLDPGAYLVDRDVKYALPLSCLVMMFCGLVLSLDPVPRASSTGRGFVLGLAIGLGYWMTLGFTIAFGRSGLMAPWVAAWLPNILFTLLAAALFLTGEER